MAEFTSRVSSPHCDLNRFKCPSLIGALWVRPVSLVSKKSMCFVVFVKEK